MTGSDHELLMAWRMGDRRAGAALFDRHFASIRRFFINKACSESEVEELVQRSFVAALESAERFRGEASVKTWLISIARNIQREWIREVLREAVDPVEPDAMCSEKVGPGITSNLDVKREQQILLTALRRLPLEQQTLLELFYWEELTANELAEVFAVPEGTIRTRLRKVKLDLRGSIETLARTQEELDSTRGGLEGWARGLRDKLAV
ncbi:RNA polymerase sigma factor [Nannocystaceae bacterium ST9]